MNGLSIQIIQKQQIKDKNVSNATNVTIKPLGRTIWKHICGNTVGKSQTNATNVTMQPLGHVI